MRPSSNRLNIQAPAAPQSRSPSGRIPRRWLPVLRGVWGVIVLLLLANMVASIPAYYRTMSAVCAFPNQVDCSTDLGQLSAASVQTLTQLHLSLSAYAAYFVTLNVLVSLLPWGNGLLLFWRKSDEWMGLFVALFLILIGANGVSNSLSGLWAPSPPSPFFAFLLTLNTAAQWIGLGAFLLTFPTGRFAPRWSWIILLFWIAVFLQPTTPPPLQSDQIGKFLQAMVSLLETVVVFGGTLFVIVYRYRRVFNATQRQQTKWVVYAAVVWFIEYMLALILSSVLPAQSPYQIFAPTLLLLLPAAILNLGLGFSILRYRLWDIDTVINRTLVYGSLSAVLSLTYVGGILLARELSLAFTQQQIGDSPLVIVGSTLLIVALFNPLRRRIQTFIDRRFYRSKYDARKVLAAFTTTLRTEVDLNDLSEHLVHAVEETMQPTHISLWLRRDWDQHDQPPR